MNSVKQFLRNVEIKAQATRIVNAMVVLNYDPEPHVERALSEDMAEAFCKLSAALGYRVEKIEADDPALMLEAAE